MKKPRIVLLVDNVHMGLSHDGLARLAVSFKADASKLGEGELLMFLNRAKDKLKILGAGGRVVGYLKMEKGRRIALDAIRFLPETFGANGFSYDSALSKALAEKLFRSKVAGKPTVAYHG